MLKAGMRAIEQSSGPLETIPDEFVITSLDVVIHYDRGKLGQGGFASVYQGDWRGVNVAVKVFETGLPADVSISFSYRMAFVKYTITGDMAFI